jgi:putative ATPase
MDLFEKKKQNSQNSTTNWQQPLATRMRPQSLDEFVGQEHLVGEGKLLRRMIETKKIGSIILYGPPSSGKTTLAHVISQETEADFVQLNAVLDGIKELRETVKIAEQKLRFQQKQTILFVDEIHRWNKAQQDALLPHIESGVIRLIGATTENPFYALINPLLSRCQLFELYPLLEENVLLMLKRCLIDDKRGLGGQKITVTDDALKHFSSYASGDVRNALNALEMAVQTSATHAGEEILITLDIAKECIQRRTIRFDKSGDEHYHMASALIKSMRGSDPDAALYWMVALIESGEDPDFIFRRFFIFASEDIGLAEPYALTLVHSAQESFNRCGMPEGWYFLAHCCLHLALAPKSNSTKGVFEAIKHINEKGIAAVPSYLKDKTANAKAARYLGTENASEDYKYPHSFPNNWVDQDYLPAELKGKTFYEAGSTGREKMIAERLSQIRSTQKES